MLLGLLLSDDSRVQHAVLGARRNLSFGRASNANKLEIATELGLRDIAFALHRARSEEVGVANGVSWRN